jgi:hypothetical protein
LRAALRLLWVNGIMRVLASLLCLAACTGGAGSTGDDDDLPPDVSKTAVYLTPAQHLTRASMVLRGLRPSIEDLEAVTADPSALGSIVDRYLASPEFGQTIRELHNETLLMELEQPQFTYPAIGPVATATAREINSLFEEPLRLIEDIVMSDEPYTKIVTADYTMANGTSAAIWGLDHSTAAEHWERTAWKDGRPALGILATNALFNRERSTGFNYNRGRANLVSSTLLCHDFLESDVQVDTSVDLSDPDIVSDAVVANPSCAGCHQTLDPLASYFFQFRNTLAPVAVDAYPITYYTPATVDRWKTTNKRPPMFFGQSSTHLGESIAADPRFAMCTAKRFAAYFSETEPSPAWIARLQKQFTDAGFNAKQLAKAIVMSDEFRISHDTDATAAASTVGFLKVRPEQYQRMLRDLTGFNWSTTPTAKLRGIPYGTANLLESDFIGFRVLAGGIDAYFVTKPVHTMNATSSLVAKAAASAAAEFAVDTDQRLFVKAPVDATDETKIREQLAYLHARFYGELVAPDSPEVDDTFALYTDAFTETGSRARAWKLVLVGMLSNFRSLFY